MTREEAKDELRVLKEMSKDIKSIEDEIERLMTVATKMTTSYEVIPSSKLSKSKIEEALVKLEDYRGRLTNQVLSCLEYRTRCLAKLEQIEPKSLQKVLRYYYFQDFTLEKTAELLDRSYQWTYEMFLSALDKYCEIS